MENTENKVREGIFYIRGDRGSRMATFGYELDKAAGNLTFAYAIRHPNEADDKKRSLEIVRGRLAKKDRNNGHVLTVSYAGKNDYEDIVAAIHSCFTAMNSNKKQPPVIPNRIMRELAFNAKYGSMRHNAKKLKEAQQ